jgi:hypothetical protein
MTAPDNPRVAQIEDDLARANQKLSAARDRVLLLQDQVAELEELLDAERAAAPAPSEAAPPEPPPPEG